MAKEPKSIDEQRLELEREVHKAQKEHNKKSIWVVPMIGGIITLAGVILTIYNDTITRNLEMR